MSEMEKGIRSLSSEQDKPDERNADNSSHQKTQTKQWTGAFWMVVGLLTTLLSVPLFGFRYEILFPALVLIGYGLFIFWNPPIAESDAPWTGVMWVTLGLVLLLTVQLFDLHWTVEVNSVIIGIFLVFIGFLVVLDL